MVPKQANTNAVLAFSFRAVLFRMVPKQPIENLLVVDSFRAVLFRMVPKRIPTVVS